MTSITFEAAMKTVVDSELLELDQEDRNIDSQIVDLERQIELLRTRQEEVVFRRGALARFVTCTPASKYSALLTEKGYNEIVLEGSTQLEAV